MNKLALTTAREYGVTFRTGHPARFSYAHNTESAPHFGTTFGQHIEPAGYYVLHVEPSAPPTRGWVRGTARVRRPLVLELTLGPETYGPLGWKARLSRAMGNRKGAALSRELVRLGYDAIVTVKAGETREIVLLRPNSRTSGTSAPSPRGRLASRLDPDPWPRTGRGRSSRAGPRARRG
jgi:hypothetical protein